MSDRGKTKRPEYSPKKGGKCNSECTYYEVGYCKITGACLTRPKPMMGPVLQADCEPFITDLRRDAEKDWPEYKEEPPAVLDEEVLEQILEVLEKTHNRMGIVVDEVKLMRQDMKMEGSG